MRKAASIASIVFGVRATAATASFLQASLFTSVVAFGVAAMAMEMGVLLVLIGLGIRDVGQRTGP